MFEIFMLLIGKIRNLTFSINDLINFFKNLYIKTFLNSKLIIFLIIISSLLKINSRLYLQREREREREGKTFTSLTIRLIAVELPTRQAIKGHFRIEYC